MGQTFGARHELVDPIAAGASGAVWRTWDHRERAYRAGKVLRQADSVSLLRFMRESGHRIDHPHVVAPLTWTGEDDRVIFAMPLVRGGTLATVMADHGPLPVWFTAAVADQLLDALAAVHAHGLVHRDVKPGNVMLEPTGTGRPFVRLGDFGIAVPVGDPRFTAVHHVVGTPGYLSPEALAGADPDPRQDVYAVGVVVLEMLTGRRPSGPEIPVDGLDSPLAQWALGLLQPSDLRPDAAQARSRLAALRLPLVPCIGDEPVEVFDQLGDLPDGWGPDGPRPGLEEPSGSRPDEVVAPTLVGPAQVPSGATPAEPPASRSVGLLPAALVVLGLVLLAVAVLLW
ncbi:hypothetical protein GCM10027030_07560 [Luteococcus sediminum]